MGIIFSMFRQAVFLPKPSYNVEDIPDQTGKVHIVTGGNTGVGKATVEALLRHNATVYLAARSAEKANAAIAELKALTGKEAIFLELDLSDLGSVRKGADEFKRKETRLDTLFQNAGVMVPPLELLTAQNYDLQFGTNVLGHAFFFQLLLPVLQATAKLGAGRPRVVVTASSAAQLSTKKDKTGLEWDTFEGQTEKGKAARKATGTEQLYCQSKYGNVVFAQWAHRKYGRDIVVTSCNPGNLRSDLQRHLKGIQARVVHAICFPVEFGALTQLYLGTAPAAADAGGKYYIPWARPSKPMDVDSRVYNEATQDRLMAWVDEQTKDFA